MVYNNTAPYVNLTKTHREMFTNESLLIECPEAKDNEKNSPIIYKLLYNGKEVLPFFMNFDSATLHLLI